MPLVAFGFVFVQLIYMMVLTRPCRQAGQSGVNVRHLKKIIKKRQTSPALSGAFKKTHKSVTVIRGDFGLPG